MTVPSVANASPLARANRRYRDGDWLSAERLFNDALDAHYEGSSPLPPVLVRQCIETIRRIATRMPLTTTHQNYVLTSCNARYFPSLIQLIRGLAEERGVTLQEVLVFDFGLERWQREILQSLVRVRVFDHDPELFTDSKGAARFDYRDPSTYFFKVHAFHHALALIRRPNAEPVNVLWVDSGISIAGTLKPVFGIIDRDEAFFVDHSDTSIFYPDAEHLLVNILSPGMFTPALGLPLPTPEHLLTPYVKAGFLGIKAGGRYDRLVLEHRRICLESDVLLDPRAITDSKLQNHWTDNTAVLELAKRRGLANPCRYLYGRHEQAVWSYLVAREGLAIQDSQRFNATVSPGAGTLTASSYDLAVGSKIERAIPEFRDGMLEFLAAHGDADHAEHPFALRTLTNRQLVARYLQKSKDIYIDRPVYTGIGFPMPRHAQRAETILHRGSLARMDEHKYSGTLLNHFANVRDDVFILLGNGPSLGDVDLPSLRDFHTFGLNAAYRAYERIGFWPTYFGCFDSLVCSHHAEAFKALVRSSPIRKFFFINVDDAGKPIFAEPDILENPRFQRIDFQPRTAEEKARPDILSLSFAPFTDARTSGSNTVQSALLLGYRKIILLGVDQNYVEVVDGAAREGRHNKLVMKETPQSNPNYWFADYQQKGDRFNLPNLQGSQISAWNKLSLTLDHLRVSAEIINCSPVSRLECFEKAPLDQALLRLNTIGSRDITAFRSPLRSGSGTGVGSA